MFQSTELTAIHADCWYLLAQAVTDRDCGWRLPVLATCCSGSVCQRTVVLRSVNAAQRKVLFHTDFRSPKVAQMQASPQVSLLFYDPLRCVQLQIHGTATIHRDDSVAQQLWNNSPPESLRNFSGPLAPGTVTEQLWTNLPPKPVDGLAERDAMTDGLKNFAAVSIVAERLDWLLLLREGNRRAGFRYVSVPTDKPDTDAGSTSLLCEWMCP